MDRPPEHTDGSIVDRDDIITLGSTMIFCNEDVAGRCTFVCPRENTDKTEEDVREDSIALVQRRTNRLHWNSAMRRRYTSMVRIRIYLTINQRRNENDLQVDKT